jgi:hypothetical protein
MEDLFKRRAVHGPARLRAGDHPSDGDLGAVRRLSRRQEEGVARPQMWPFIA